MKATVWLHRGRGWRFLIQWKLKSKPVGSAGYNRLWFCWMWFYCLCLFIISAWLLLKLWNFCLSIIWHSEIIQDRTGCLEFSFSSSCVGSASINRLKKASDGNCYCCYITNIKFIWSRVYGETMSLVTMTVNGNYKILAHWISSHPQRFSWAGCFREIVISQPDCKQKAERASWADMSLAKCSIVISCFPCVIK